MQAQQLLDELLAAILLVAGLLIAKPVITWLMMKLYNLFIGAGHY